MRDSRSQLPPSPKWNPEWLYYCMADKVHEQEPQCGAAYMYLGMIVWNICTCSYLRCGPCFCTLSANNTVIFLVCEFCWQVASSIYPYILNLSLHFKFISERNGFKNSCLCSFSDCCNKNCYAVPPMYLQLICVILAHAPTWCPTVSTLAPSLFLAKSCRS